MSNTTKIPMPVINPPSKRRWGLGHWRVVSLVAVHVLMIAHATQWLITGTTVSPIEPSESMETLQTGAINAGFVFFAVALLITLIFGRFVCGWACHFVAYQDLSRWLLGKCGIHPKPLRSRLLIFVPLGMALYMFVWPSAYRVYKAWRGDDPRVSTFFPEWSNGFTTQHFWETFPGWVFAILSVGIAGFAVVYFLGAKGFCTYACPYGGFFGIADRFAPLRVRVSDACDHTGVCTTACSSNVDVAGEVLRYGMVVSPGCMKCGDCIRSCPNTALTWSVGKPAILQHAKPPAAEKPAAMFRMWEELLLLALFLFFLLSWRGLYGGFPFLMSAGMSAIMAYVTLLGVQLLYRRDVTLQTRALRAASGVTPFGKLYGVLTCVLVLFTAYSALVQYHRFMGNRWFDRIVVGEIAREPEFDPQRDLDAETRAARDIAAEHYAKYLKWGLRDTVDVQFRMAWVDLLRGDRDAAERQVRAALVDQPHWANLHYLLGIVLRADGRNEEAIVAYREALAEAPHMREAAQQLGITLIRAGRYDEAIEHYQTVTQDCPDDAGAFYHLGALRVDRGQVVAGVADLEHAIEVQPDFPDAQYQLGLALLQLQKIDDAIEHLETAIRLSPQMAPAHYNLAVACFMKGDLPAALTHVRDSLKLAPDDVQAQRFHDMLAQQLNQTP
ncbi:MAG: tetratricopeptide repeat protein [Phycisphaerales bacterium]|nr:tetratricopeptide repeat protein [Phycisphaerales bacterium]